MIIDDFYFIKLELLTPVSISIQFVKSNLNTKNMLACKNRCEKTKKKQREVNNSLTCLRLTLNPTPPLLQHRQVRSSRTKETSPEQEMRMTT